MLKPDRIHPDDGSHRLSASPSSGLCAAGGAVGRARHAARRPTFLNSMRRRRSASALLVTALVFGLVRIFDIGDRSRHGLLERPMAYCVWSPPAAESHRYADTRARHLDGVRSGRTGRCRSSRFLAVRDVFRLVDDGHPASFLGRGIVVRLSRTKPRLWLVASGHRLAGFVGVLVMPSSSRPVGQRRRCR